MVLAQPAGSTPQAREANLGQLNGFVVEWQGQQTPVSMRRYEWLIPTTVRAGSGALLLRDGNGRLLSHRLTRLSFQEVARSAGTQ
jgi:hypothetical protein